MSNFRVFSRSSDKYYKGQHRFEHWYRDNTVYFITARTRDGYHAFLSKDAKAIFWDRFDHYTQQFNFQPWVTTIVSNHYHTLGYLSKKENLGILMQRLHGSVAKLVNDLLPDRHLPFWREAGQHDYFDGCIRDEKQCRRAYAYTLTQSVRHKLCKDYRAYPHTHVNVDLDIGVKWALEQHAFMEGIPYKRYQKNPRATR
jgi:hypothetical protein